MFRIYTNHKTRNSIFFYFLFLHNNTSNIYDNKQYMAKIYIYIYGNISSKRAKNIQYTHPRSSQRCGPGRSKWGRQYTIRTSQQVVSSVYRIGSLKFCQLYAQCSRYSHLSLISFLSTGYSYFAISQLVIYIYAYNSKNIRYPVSYAPSSQLSQLNL
jgi:hypothetical protein